jgi:hypothetical protein
MQLGEDSRRLGKQHRAKKAAGWAEVGPGRPAQADRPSPLRGPISPPFDLATNRTIYSLEAKSHASILSSIAAEE